jgi:hypothetical protein
VKPIYFIVTVQIAVLNACGPQAVPTIDPVQVQASAIAVASTMIAQTNEPVSITPAQPLPSNGGSQPSTSWFSGGTLHRSTIREWRRATYSNRLATAADFIASTQSVDYGDMNGFKRMATDLETCISTTAEGGAADNEQTAFVSALCMTQLFP